MKEPFLHALPILKKIENAGFDAYFIGGSVRDLLLGRKIADVDIATSATPMEVKQIFPKTIDVGIEHGTVVIPFNGQMYEVTTFRAESEYEDFRRPKEVQFIRSLQEDQKRRDFTMNAIAMDKLGNMIDPFFGRKAIEEGIIKTVGVAEERFQEDALRMMRAVRFLSQLSFKLDHETFLGIVQNRDLLEKIAVERIVVEFEKLLMGKNRRQALKILIESGLYQYLPGCSSFRNEIEKLSMLEIESLELDQIWLLLIYLFGLKGKMVMDFLKKWKLPSKKIQWIQKGAAWLERRVEKNWSINSLYQAKLDIAISVERVYNVLSHNQVDESTSYIRQTYLALPIKELSDLTISGNELMEWYGLAAGPWIKEKITIIENAVLYQQVENKKDSIKEWLFKCNQS
ncbi:CCA tRNA nucleotidyltransferase [Cytobacillus sp. Hz8]|uniref:CCA tRNA nucleotidyltransferase n=1 Tax=Cytobacillus sp. Hz8 TaxID=3347168 RepID=UPI0035D7163C